MSPRSPDTTPAAWAKYQDVLDGMDGPARLLAALELSEAVRDIRLAGLKARHPQLTASELVARWVLEEHGVALPGER